MHRQIPENKLTEAPIGDLLEGHYTATQSTATFPDLASRYPQTRPLNKKVRAETRNHGFRLKLNPLTRGEHIKGTKRMIGANPPLLSSEGVSKQVGLQIGALEAVIELPASRIAPDGKSSETERFLVFGYLDKTAKHSYPKS